MKVTDDTPFKERFRRIPPPLVEEVRNHLRDMLESGTIRPSQSAWCNALWYWYGKRTVATYAFALISTI